MRRRRTADRSLRRVTRLCATLALGVLGIAAGAMVAPVATASTFGFLAPFWVDYGHHRTFTVPQVGTVKAPFGLVSTGRFRNASVTLDTADLSSRRLSVVGVSGPCARAGTKITCTFNDLGPGRYAAYLLLRANDGAGSGSAGRVRLTTTSNRGYQYSSSTTGEARISSTSAVADLAISASSAEGKKGSTVAVAVTIHNKGPSVEPLITLADIRPQHGTVFAGGEGCSRGYASTVECRRQNLAVGATVVVSLHFRILGCDITHAGTGQEGGSIADARFALGDPNPENSPYLTFAIKVAGCAGAAPPAGRPAPTSTAPTSTAAAPGIAATGGNTNPVKAPPKTTANTSPTRTTTTTRAATPTRAGAESSTEDPGAVDPGVSADPLPSQDPPVTVEPGPATDPGQIIAEPDSLSRPRPRQVTNWPATIGVFGSLLLLGLMVLGLSLARRRDFYSGGGERPTPRHAARA